MEPSHPFLADTAVTAAGPGRWTATIDRKWWIVRGPNGGYVAAILLRALTALVADDERPPRSLTVHYIAPPEEGAVELEGEVLRAGRSLTSCTVRMRQGGRTVAVALAAFSRGRRSPEFCDLEPPRFAPPESLDRIAHVEGMTPPLMRQFDLRPAIGGLPFSGGEEAVVGGWMRLDPALALDHVVLAAYTDAWAPAVFARSSAPVGVPTIDLTVHFRAPIPTLPPDAHCAAVFRTQVSRDGFLEEDGEIWSPDGVLLAHSRQLALHLT